DVVACKDGYEALRYLQTNTCDALITDINMPNMNGFQLVEQVRRLDAHRELPILLVTSLGSDEDRMRGMQVGADGYIVKRDFEQGRFLHMLEALL
ncbi:MAG TPA: response regulator, partial [Blastocatellia bacterium]|nr:response regulator [Blastocatellia bacterium]